MKMALNRSVSAIAAGLLLASAIPATAAPKQVFGDTPACANGSNKTAVLVTADGFRDREGNLRVIVYRALEEEYFVSGAYVNRIDTPMTRKGSITVCAELPGPGDYVVVALHDRDKNGKIGIRDGVGFANNPELKLSTKKPPLEENTVKISGVQPFNIVMNYVQGFAVKPIRRR